MSIKRALTDRVTAKRTTRVQDAHGYHDATAPLGWGPLPATIQLTQTYENGPNGTTGDVSVGFQTATILGWPDLAPADIIVDQNGREFPVTGDIDRKRAGRVKVTIVRLRTAELVAGGL